MGVITSTVWAGRMDAAHRSKDKDQVIRLVDQLLAREEYEDRGERRVGRWWSALTGGTPDVNDLEDYQLTREQLNQRNAFRENKRQQMIATFMEGAN